MSRPLGRRCIDRSRSRLQVVLHARRLSCAARPWRSVVLLSVSHVAKRFGPTVVLADVSFTVNEGDRLALVGANGAGKSTLLKIVAGQLIPDAGEVVIPRPIDVGYLPQSVEAPPGQTIEQLVRASQERLHQIGERLRALEESLG